MIKNAKSIGFLYIITADLLWGLSGTAAKYFFNRQVSPFDLVQMRLLFSALLLLLIMSLFSPQTVKVKRKDLPYLMIFGILGMSLVQFTYLYTIKETNVATAIFLEYLAPVFILLYQLLSRREALSADKLVSLACAVFGGFLIIKGQPGSGMMITPIGLITGLTSAVAFAFYTVYSGYGIKKYSSWTVLLWGLIFGGLAWCLYRPPWETFLAYGRTEWLFFIYLALFATIAPFGLFFLGLKYLSPTAAGITSTMEPVMASVMAYLILGEVLTLIQIAGGVMIIAAVILIQFSGTEKVRPDN